MGKVSKLIKMIRISKDTAAKELKQEVLSNYSFVLNQMRKFENVLGEKFYIKNFDNYTKIKTNLISAFDNWNSYIITNCNDILEKEKTKNYKTELGDVNSNLSAFRARVDLNNEYVKIINDFNIFEDVMNRLHFNKKGDGYTNLRNEFMESFKKYYNFVDLKLRDNVIND